MRLFKHTSALVILMAGVLALQGCGQKQDGAGRPTVGFVTNGIASFWVIADKGARDAAAEFDVNVEVLMP